jgi:membrane AbrB-like protein
MFAAIFLALRGAELRLPNSCFFFAQGLVGCLMARGIPVSSLSELAGYWPLFVGGTLWAMFVSGLLGWVLIRQKVLPGTTAIWGVSPGAASAMIIMSEAYGGDMRLVAFMQYLRVVFVSLVVAMVAHFLTPEAAAAGAAASQAPAAPVNWPGLGKTLLFTGAAVWLSLIVKMPGGPVLLPMVAGIFLHHSGLWPLELPPHLMTVTYAAIGWAVGFRFSGQVIRAAFKALPKLMLVIIVMTAACALFGGFMTLAFDFDPMTAYLATCPGGMDTVAIIALGSQVDFPFIMTMQTARILLVFFFGPGLSRFMAVKMLQ